MAEATLSAKNQIVIPKEARESLGLKAGDKLLVVVHDNSMIVIQKPESHEDAIHGIAKGAYPDNYLNEERRSWR